MSKKELEENESVFNGFNSIFATRLRELMTINKTTQLVLSDKIGVSRQAISQYADGSIQPNIEKLHKISDYFECSTDYLLGKSVSKNADNEEIRKRIGLNDESIKILERLNNEKLVKMGRSYKIDFINDLINVKGE